MKADANLAVSSGLPGGRDGFVWKTDYQNRYVIWLPIPVFLLLIAVLWYTKIDCVFEPPYLLALLNFTFSTAVSIFIAGLAAISFARNGTLPVLLMGCGMLVFGAVSLIAAVAIHVGQINAGLTVYNTGMCLSAACHIMAAAALAAYERIHRNAVLLLAGSYGLALMIIGVLAFAASEDLTPTFFIQGKGATALRQAVLGTAIGLFGLAGGMIAFISRRHQWRFGQWYAASLGLIATGLFGVLIISNVGSPLGWTGRAAQYLGGLYMFGAVWVAARENGEWDAALQVALREKERLFQTVVENSRDGIHQFDLVEKRYVFMSPAQERLTGFSCDELMLNLEGSAERLHPEDRGIVERYMERLMAGQEMDAPMEYRWRVKSGEYRWFSDVRSIVCDAQGRPVSLVGNSRDITESKRIEKELQQAHDDLEMRVNERTTELRKRTEQLARLSSELTMAEQRERQRLAQVLHDHLQQLLAGAKLQLEVLATNIPDEQKPRAQKVVDLLAESLKASRSLTMELAPPVLKYKGIGAALAWLAGWMEETHGLCMEVKAGTRTDIDREDIRVLIFLSVRELLFNIVKHAGVTAATVELATRDDDCLHVTVCDYGKGFDAEKLLSGEKAVEGFGLHTIGERLKLIGGRVIVESTIGSGSRFTLVVPKSAETPVQPATKRAFLHEDHEDHEEGHLF